MKRQQRPIRWGLALLAVACLGLAAAGCGLGEGTFGGSGERSRAPAAPRQIADSDLPKLLLSANAMPAGFVPAGTYLLPNDEVARYFPDPGAALAAMNERGRMQGAVADYRLGGAPRAAHSAVVVSSSVAWYGSRAGAEATLADPTMELVIHRLGLEAGEIRLAGVGQESRAFRGVRQGDAADWISYLVLFRQENMVGAVVVVVSAANDDGGRLAVQMARRQALLRLREVVY